MKFKEVYGKALNSFNELTVVDEFRDLLRVIFIFYVADEIEDEKLRDDFIKFCGESLNYLLNKEVNYGESGGSEEEKGNDKEQ